MSTDSEKSFIPEPSQGDYWGGYMLETWFYKLLSIFPLTGFLGIDHLALRSPFTAMLKFLVNVLFWGAWYFYDIIQMMMDNTFVAKYGLSTPWGPRGHGYKLFKDLTENNTNEFGKPSAYYSGFLGSFLFVLYTWSTAFLSFTGLPSFIAGDYVGGLVKLCTIFLFPVYMVTGIYEHFTSGGLEKEGVPRSWPIISPGIMPTLLINDPVDHYPAVNLLPKEESEKQLKAYKQEVADWKANGNKPMLQGFLDIGYTWATAPLIPLQAIGATKGMALAASDVGQSLAKAVQKKVASNPDAVIDSFLGKASVPALPVPIEIKENIALDNPLLKQTGGGDIGYGLDTILMGGIIVLVLGGFATALLRKLVPPPQSENEYPRKNYDGDDLPPIPGRT